MLDLLLVWVVLLISSKTYFVNARRVCIDSKAESAISKCGLDSPLDSPIASVVLMAY